MNRKKEREAYFVGMFFHFTGLSGRVIEEREAPDFILEIEGKTVGLEVTEVFIRDDGSPLGPKAKESVVARIVEGARRLYEEAGGKPLHVSLGFSSSTYIQTVNRNQTAAAVANFLLELDPPVDELVKWKPSYKDNALPPCITFMHILAVPSETMAHWHAPQAGWVAPLSEQVLQTCVDEKAAKLTKYRSAAPEIWLLLAVEGRAPSQFFDRRPDIRPDAIRSPFDRTYLLSLIEGTVQEVGVLK